MRCRVPRQLQRSWDLRRREQNLSLFLRVGWNVLRGAKILRVRDGERDGTVERVNKYFNNFVDPWIAIRCPRIYFIYLLLSDGT